MNKFRDSSIRLFLSFCFIFIIDIAYNAVASSPAKNEMQVLTTEEVTIIYKDFASAWQNQDYDKMVENVIDVAGEEPKKHYETLFSEGVYMLSAKVNSLERITTDELNKRVEQKLRKLHENDWKIADVTADEIPEGVLKANEDFPRDDMFDDEKRNKLHEEIENQIAQEGSIYVANVTFYYTNGIIEDDEQKFVFHDGRWKVYVR